MSKNPYLLNLNRQKPKKYPVKRLLGILAALLLSFIFIYIILFTKLAPGFLNPVKEKFAESKPAQKLATELIKSNMDDGTTKYSSAKNRCSLTLPPNWKEAEPTSKSLDMFFVNDSTEFGVDFKAFLSVSKYVDIGTELPTRVFRNYEARLVSTISGTVLDDGYKLYEGMTCKWFLLESPMSESIHVIYYLIIYKNRLYIVSCEARKEIFESHMTWLTAPLETFRVLDYESEE